MSRVYGPDGKTVIGVAQACSEDLEIVPDERFLTLRRRAPRLTPLRGRVVIRELFEDSSTLWTPTGNPRERLTHRGVVLALGPPALTPSGAEVPYEYEVGAQVQFHFTATEKGRIAPWTDGKPALWMAWFEIDAVIEASCDTEYAYQNWPGGIVRHTTCRRPKGHDGKHVGEEKT